MKSNFQRIISLLLCLGLILCIAGCGDDDTASGKKKKKKIIVKKRANTSDVSGDDLSGVTDDVSSLLMYDDTSSNDANDTTRRIKTHTVSIKDYTVNGIPRAYVTTANTDIKFRRQTDDKIKVYDKSQLDRSTGAVIEVDPNKTYQNIQGFGCSMTQSSVYNMEVMSAAQRTTLMTRLFDPENGIGLSILRQPIGCGDYNYLYYTYDEMPEGETDYDLAHFDFTKEVDFPVVTDKGEEINLGIIPYTTWASTLNPDMMFVGAVWTAPRWMKTIYSWNTKGGTELKTECYDVYTRYFIKSIECFKENGVDFYFVVPQNEPTGKHGIPATYYSSIAMNKLVNYFIKPAMEEKNMTTKLFAWDFNWFEDTCLSFVGGQYGNIDGVAFHFYAGESSVMGTIHEMFPDLEIFLTEAAGNSVGGQPVQMFRQMKYMHECFRLGNSAWILWNICLDTKVDSSDTNGPGGNDGGPTHGNGPQDMNVYGTGLTEYDPEKRTLVYQMDFYALAHMSKYIHRGAKIVESTDLNVEDSMLYDICAVNEDGTAVVVLGNESPKETTFKIVFADKVIEFTLAGESMLTLAWDANTYL